MKCVFCDKKIKEQSFMESENFMAVINISPVVKGHSLIIPKKHITSFFDLDRKEMAEMLDLTKKATRYLLKFYKVEEFNLIINQGKHAGQRIEHLHLHILPREKKIVEHPHEATLEVITKEKTKDRKIFLEDEVKKVTNDLKEFINQQ